MDKECPKDRQCTKEGRCTATFIKYTGRWGCNPSSTAHCAQSKKCKSHGLCAFDKDLETGPGCVAEASACAASDACTKDGHCTATKGVDVCRPSLTRHCTKSEACKKKGLCRRHPGDEPYFARCVKGIPLVEGQSGTPPEPAGKTTSP